MIRASKGPHPPPSRYQITLAPSLLHKTINTESKQFPYYKNYVNYAGQR